MVIMLAYPPVETGDVHEDPVGYESTAKGVARGTERPMGKALLVAIICCRVMWWGTTGDCEQVCRESKTPRTYTR